MASFEEHNALALEPQAPAAVETAAIPNPFAALGLAPELLAAVADLGFSEPTAVQQRAIPLALQPHAAGFNDLMVSSQTGSGKTAAFLLPVLHTLLGLQQNAAAREQAAWDAKVAPHAGSRSQKARQQQGPQRRHQGLQHHEQNPGRGPGQQGR